MSIDNFTHPDRIREIIALDDAVVRNLQITQSYHELASAFVPIYGDNLLWPVFGVWASKQAGHFIRNEEVPEALRDLLTFDASGPRPFGPLTPLLGRGEILRYAQISVKDVSKHIADGNHLVYRHLAPLFAAFLKVVRRTSEPDPQPLEIFLAGIDSDIGKGEELRKAFTQYYEAIFERNAKRRTERILLANLLIGLHEQKRLQETIKNSISSPIRRAFEDPQRRLGPFPLPLFVRRILTALGSRFLGATIDAFEDEWERLMTRCMMTMSLPQGVLDLSQDVPPLPDGSTYPPALREITFPPLEEALSKLDREPRGTLHSGAKDWTEIEDRMAFITELFRSRQQEEDLLLSPFETQQVSKIREGQLPNGDL